MDIPDIQAIKHMTDEEIHALNAELGKKVLKQFALIFAIKWALIIGTSYAITKALADMEPKKS